MTRLDALRALEADPKLTELLRKAAQIKMTPGERQQQKISFAWGNLPEGSPLTLEQVAQMVYETEGDIFGMEREIAALKAENERLRDALFSASKIDRAKALSDMAELDGQFLTAADATTTTGDNDAPP